jgi:uncharacterized membrane protein YbhN (UPF0104 family)
MLPAGGLVGPALAVPSAHRPRTSLGQRARAPGVLVLTWLLGRRAALGVQPRRPVPRSLRWMTRSARMVRDGAAEARELLAGGNRKLLGAMVAYYAFENAVLWAAFRAYGGTPPLGEIVMGYLVGSLAAAAPIPAGLGVLDGGLIGALVLYGAPLAPAAGAVLLYRAISLGLVVALSATSWAARRPQRPRAAWTTTEPHSRLTGMTVAGGARFAAGRWA